MQLNTIQRKKAKGGFREPWGMEELVNRMYQTIKMGKQGLDRGLEGSGNGKSALVQTGGFG